jgi:DNA-3-methyladenine glycosylase
MKPLTKRFYDKPTLAVARELLGCYLVHGKCVGKIVETEAYLWDDPASHSYRGKTKRNMAMFGAAGKAYVYFIYGNHFCFNVVTNKEEIGEAVLIRALEPVKGIELMKKRRGVEDVRQLCNGPGKLTQAMGITMKENGKSLVDGKLRIVEGERVMGSEIVMTKRIGITKGAEMPHRFYIRGNKFVSKP